MALSAKQKRAARYLGLYMTQVEAARRVVVNPRTIRRWLTDDAEFAALGQDEREAPARLCIDRHGQAGAGEHIRRARARSQGGRGVD
jgi:hypothetical protein